MLRKGWTTGACAAAAAKAACQALLTGAFPDLVSIRLPKGEAPSFALHRTEMGPGWATSSIIKDAGDDPDVTHGAEIITTIAYAPPGAGIRFFAGEGVGIVTLPGLPLAVGEPAINPMPRKMIAEALAAVAGDGLRDFDVTIAIANGAELAKKTMNGRLGILGGLSVLGTTGVVVPYSCAAWIHAIQRGVDVARAAGIEHVAGCTGSTSEAVLRGLYPGLSEQAFIDMGGFAGGLLKYLRVHPVPRLTLGGGFAKLVKLAQGAMDLHSGRSAVDQIGLARMLAELGAPPALMAKAAEAASGARMLALAEEHGFALGDLVARRAREVAMAILAGSVEIEVVAIDRGGRIVGRAGA